MKGRGVPDAAFVAVRCLHAAFFLGTSLYGALTYSLFTYQQFIAPRVVEGISQFASWHYAIYWAVFGMTVFTLMPRLKRGRGRALAWGYVIAGSGMGVWLTLRPALAELGSSRASLWVAGAALVPILWVGLIDHLNSHGPWSVSASIEGWSEAWRRLWACLATAVYTWAIYALMAAALRDVPGIRLTMTDVVAAGGWALILHLLAFSAVFLLLLIGTVLSMSAAGVLSRRGDYVLAVTAAMAIIGGAIQTIAWPSLSFPAAAAWALSLGFALAITVTWSAIALRWMRTDGRLDGLNVLFGSLSGSRGPVAMAGLIVLPGLAYAMSTAVAGYDWDFILQKLSVIVVSVCAFGCIQALIPAVRPGRPWRLVLPAVLILAAYEAVLVGQRSPLSHVSLQILLDEYVAVNPSFRLISDVLREGIAEGKPELAGNASAFYAYLRANTNIPKDVRIEPIEIDFVRPLVTATTEKPYIFLLVIDSLRRDYLSPYNPAVTFTAEFGRFADESLVFRNAFTRYGGTALAVPSIWAGMLLLHKEYVTPFQPMNTLQKLLTTEGYRRVMSMDSVMKQLDPPSPDLTEIDGDVTNIHFDLCRSLDEFQGVIDHSAADSRPIFAYTLPQNIHIINVQNPYGPSGEHYPGFYDRAAVRVHRLDECFGRFIGGLKARGLYDRSVVIITSDHGDSLGEEGRWGHGVTLFPEVVRIPLIIHVPPAMMRQRAVDLDRVSFSTDITPTLYALLGHHPSVGDPMFGQSLIVDPATDLSDRRRRAFVLASSYGPSYAVLTRNGRQLYIVDGIRGREYSYDLSSDLNGRRRQLTDGNRRIYQDIIRGQIDELARLYRFEPHR
jgi:hypothetical protein